MPNWNASTTVNLGVGEQQTLANADLSGSFATNAFVVGRDGAQIPMTAWWNNTNQDCTIQCAMSDVDANYIGAGFVSAGNVIFFTGFGFFRGKFASNPTGTLIVER